MRYEPWPEAGSAIADDERTGHTETATAGVAAENTAPIQLPEGMLGEASGDTPSLVAHYFRDAQRHSLLGEPAERRLSARLARALDILARHRDLPEGTPQTLRDVTEDLTEADLETTYARRALRIAMVCRRTLIQSNLRLAVHLARRHTNRGIPLTDLIQEGNVGLIKAVERFDPGKGFRFSTYAYWWISEEIKRSLKRGRRVVRTPEHVVDEIRALQAAMNQLYRRHGRAPSQQELARHLAIPAQRVGELLAYAQPEVSTATPLGEGDDIHLGEALSNDDERDQPEASLLPRDQKRLLGDILSNLNERERDILSRRFGLGLPEPETLQIISDNLGISRERVRQIEKGALAKLRERYANLADMAGN